MNEEKRALFDDDGKLIPDPTPIEIASELQQPSTNLFELVREAVRSEGLRRAAEESGDESFEESDDFDVGDDFDPNSPWEGDFDTPLEVLVEQFREHQMKLRGGRPDVVPSHEQMAPGPSPGASQNKAGAGTAPPSPLVSGEN